MRDIIVGRRALMMLAAGWIVSAPRPVMAATKRPLPAVNRRRRVIALDPGHGGVDPGAISPHGLYEKRITLATAREMARQLELTGRYQVVLTRRFDRFVPLTERIARARAGRAELFLSLHADALPDATLHG